MIFDEKNEQDLVALSPAVDKDPMSLFLRRYFPFSGKVCNAMCVTYNVLLTASIESGATRSCKNV